MELMNNTQDTRDLAKPIETKLDQCQLLTATLFPEQQQSLDDDDDETVSYERYSQFKDESDMMDSEFMQRSSQWKLIQSNLCSQFQARFLLLHYW